MEKTDILMRAPVGTKDTQVNAPQVDGGIALVPNETEQSLQEIERAASKTQQNLVALGRSALFRRKTHSLERDLESALQVLQNSEHLQKVGSTPIILYWPSGRVCGQVLANWKVEDCLRYSAKELLLQKGIGRSRLKGLVEAMKCAALGGVVQTSKSGQSSFRQRDGAYVWTEKLLPEDKREATWIFEEGAGCSEFNSPGANLLKSLPRVLGFSPLVLLWMNAKTLQRKVAVTLGVTESRISQILSEKGDRLKCYVQSTMPEMISSWEAYLSQPAVYTDLFMHPWFDFISADEDRKKVGRFFLSVLEAKHPVLHNGELEDYWCMDPGALKVLARNIEARLPQTVGELKEYLKEQSLAVSEEALRAAFARTVTYISDAGIWYPDRKTALEYVLKHTSEPLTRVEIAKALGVRPSQTKVLLLEYPGLVRSGPNLKRRYMLPH